MIAASILTSFFLREAVPSGVSERSEPTSKVAANVRNSRRQCEHPHLEFESNNDVHCTYCGADFTD